MKITIGKYKKTIGANRSDFLVREGREPLI